MSMMQQAMTAFAYELPRPAKLMVLVLLGSACSGPVKGSHPGAMGGGDVGDDGGGYIPPEDDAAVPLCDDTQGTPGACALPNADADAGCGRLLSYCTNARPLLKPAVAASLIACLSN